MIFDDSDPDRKCVGWVKTFANVMEEWVDLRHIWSVLVVLVHFEYEINCCAELKGG